MTRTTSFLFLTLLTLAGCDRIHGSGVAIDDPRDVGAFDGVHASAGIVVEVSPGPLAVVVHGDDNLVASVETRVSDTTLLVRPLHDLDPVVPLVVEVHSPALAHVRSASGAVVIADELRTETTLLADSGGSLDATGTVEHAELRASSGGVLHTDGLAADDVTLAADSGGSAVVRALASVRGTVRGGASVTVRGSPAERAVETSGGGSLRWE